MCRSIISLALVLSATTLPISAEAFESFITVQGDKLMSGPDEFQFVSFAIAVSHRDVVSREFDNTAFDKAALNKAESWRFPNEFEIHDALMTIQQLGGTVIRIHRLSLPKSVEKFSEFDKARLQSLDQFLVMANRLGIRLIIPLVDYQSSFPNDATSFEAFQRNARAIIQRQNPLTGTRYCDDKTLLGWEICVGLTDPSEWIGRAAAYIKSLDSNHHVIGGCEVVITYKGQSAQSFSALTGDPNIDIVAAHHHTAGDAGFAARVAETTGHVLGQKPHLVNVHGGILPSALESALNTMMAAKVSGCLIWSLDYRSREGGFCGLSSLGRSTSGDSTSGDVEHAVTYRWHGPPIEEIDEPASATGVATLFAVAQRKAFEVQGQTLPPAICPAPPHLLPIADHAAITWQGSVGATDYHVDRGWSADGPWFAAGVNISEVADPGHPLFADEKAAYRKAYFYRVAAANIAGISPPSNVVGPVEVVDRVFVDPLRDFSLIASRGGDGLEIENGDSPRFLQDPHRLAGKEGDWFTYSVDGDLKQIRIDVFYEGDVVDPAFAVSADGNTFQVIVAQRSDLFDNRRVTAASQSWKAVQYVGPVTESARHLRIRFTGEAQIGHVVLRYDF